MNRLFLLGITVPLVLLLIPNNVLAWNWSQPFSLGNLDFDHWLGGFDNGQGYQPYNNGYQAGIADAVYDHNQGLVYNPYPQCCHSQIYSDDFKRGYDQQWNTYQSQEQQTTQHSNIYINNSPGAYVNTAQSSNQGQDQSYRTDIRQQPLKK
ncbi:MAG TPA: hypothetical protein VEH06_14495 [Candidatus Bathyarchaeia archaeon]|nr:hypothetical protein [Candidatus Bathyarchaeia archaeon]